MPSNPKFYTSRTWRKFREYVITKNNGQCSRCGQIYTDTSQLELHHIKYLEGNDYHDPTKAFNEDNIEVICHTCHNKEHDRFRTRKEVYIVFGPPLSGKTTYVRENKYDSDIVVDLDKLQEAITLNPTYMQMDAVKHNLFRLRDALLDQIKTRYGNWRRAWIIGGYQNTFDRERIVKELQADAAILMETTKEECLERLHRVTDYRKDKIDEWTSYINNWFESYTPPSY